jgi:hypothetical protein
LLAEAVLKYIEGTVNKKTMTSGKDVKDEAK